MIIERSLTISEFQEFDRALLSRLYFESICNTFTWFDENRLAGIAFDSDTEGEYILVAKQKNQIVGFASLWLPDRFIHHLYIDKRYRHQGVGKELLLASLQKLGGNATLKCLARNELAVEFYRKNGGLQSRTGHSEDGEYILFEWINNPI